MFGPEYVQRLIRKHHGYGYTLFIDEVFVKNQGTQHYLWRAVDQDGEVVDVFLQHGVMERPQNASFSRILLKHRRELCKIVTDKLRSYNVAHKDLIPEAIHDTTQYASYRAELSYELTRVRERGMRKFKSLE